LFIVTQTIIPVSSGVDTDAFVVGGKRHQTACPATVHLSQLETLQFQAAK
jgi:hypothetical protein